MDIKPEQIKKIELDYHWAERQGALLNELVKKVNEIVDEINSTKGGVI